MIKKRSLHLTEKAIGKLGAEAKPYRVYDDDVPALALEVRPSGSRRWVMRRMRHGRQRQHDLGAWPEITVYEARDAARALAAEIERGTLPVSTTPTLRRAWAHYKRRHLPRLAPRTATEYEDRWWPLLEPLADKHLDAITRADVAKLHAELLETSVVTANRTRALLSSIYGRALEWGLCSCPSPTAAVRPAPEAPRKRYLSRAEVQALLSALEGEIPVIRDYIKVLLMTGARSGEVKAMRWDEIRDGLWMHPAKRGVVTVPLVPQVQAIIDARPRLNEWVFPSRFCGGGHIVSPHLRWPVICARAKLDGVRLHDLRHTFASWQAMQGASLQVIGASLGHTRTTTTERYAHLQLGTVRRSVEAGVNAMMGGADDDEAAQA